MARRAWVVASATLALVAAAVNATAVAASPALTTGAGLGNEEVWYASELNEVSTACVATTWTDAGTGTDAAVAVSVQGTSYAGTANDQLWASGCDTLQSGAGTATLSLSGTNPLGAQLSCTFPSGFYGRVAGIIQMTFTGSCTVDNLISSGVTLNTTGVWVPLPSVLFRPGIAAAEITQAWQIVP